jgi:hypothetical protein
MIKGTAIFALSVWFGLNGLIWYSKPKDLVWLLESSACWASFFSAHSLSMCNGPLDGRNERNRECNYSCGLPEIA